MGVDAGYVAEHLTSLLDNAEAFDFDAGWGPFDFSCKRDTYYCCVVKSCFDQNHLSYNIHDI